MRDSLSRGVDINTLSEAGWFGLAIAAEGNYLELLEIFLSHPQIKINNIGNKQQHWHKQTALMVACRCGNSAIVTRLVQVPGLDINLQDGCGFTAVHHCSGVGETECLRIMAETGKVDWNKKDKYGETPLFWALRVGHSDVVDFIVQQPHIDYNVRTNDGKTLAQAAVKWGGVKFVETLAALDRCDCWNVPDSDGDTPNMKAFM